MKKTILPLLILISVSAARASDTLTVGQVFNFNVGDTFDYMYTFTYNEVSGGGYVYSQTYARFVIIGKTISANNDSITYIREQVYPSIQIDTVFYTRLDSSVFSIFDTISVSQYLTFDTSTLPDGRLINLLSENVSLGPWYSDGYGEGLGVTSSSTSQTDGISWSEEFDTTLIYYSKGGDTSGIPFYADTVIPIYIPIPEECAFWNYTDYNPPFNTYQIRTGTKVFLNSHTYVELILRSTTDGILHTDSSIGFFRNDTIGKKVYYSTTIGGNESVLYDFTMQNTLGFGNYGYTGVTLSSFDIGAINRSQWSAFAVDPFGDLTNGGVVVSGIGSVTCLFPSGNLFNPNCQQSLTSFCVCGQTLYPDTASGQCALLGIQNITTENLNINLYPNPATGTLHLYISQPDRGCQLVLTDLPGSELLSQTISQIETTIDISHLASGIYIWRLTTADGTVRTGKVVKE